MNLVDRPVNASMSQGFRRFASWGAAALLFLTPLWVFPLSWGTASAKTAFVVFGAWVLFGAWVCAAWTKQGGTVRVPWALGTALLLIPAAVLSLVFAANRCFSAGSLMLLLVYLGLAFAFFHLSSTDAVLRRMLVALLAAASMACILAVLQYVGVLGDPLLDPVERITSTFGNRNFLGSFAAAAVLPCASLLLRQRRGVARYAIGVGLTLCCFIPGLVQQTGSLLALAAGGAFCTLAVPLLHLGSALRANSRAVLGIALVVCLGMGAGLALWSTRPHVPVQSDSGEWIRDLWVGNDGQVREIDWGAAWEMFKDRPVTGVGLGNYKVEFLEYKSRFLSTADTDRYPFRVTRAVQAHNDYLQAAAEMGIPGVVAGLALIAGLAGSAWIRCRHACCPEGRLRLVLHYAGIVVVGVHATVSFPLHLPTTGLLAVALLGLSSSSALSERSIFTVRIPRRTAQALLVLAVACLVVIGVASGREFLAQISFTRGIRQMDSGDLDQAQQTFERSMTQSICPSEAAFRAASVAVLRSDLLRQAEDSLGAAALVDRAFGYASRSVDAYPTEQGLLLFGGLAAMRQDWFLAEQVLSQLLASMPWYEFQGDARYLVASMHAQQGEIEPALRELRSLIADYRTHVQAHVLLGQLLYQRGDVDGAYQAWTTALEVIQMKRAQIASEWAFADARTRRRLNNDQEQLLIQERTVQSLLEER